MSVAQFAPHPQPSPRDAGRGGVSDSFSSRAAEPRWVLAEIRERSHPLQPPILVRRFAVEQTEEQLLQLTRDRAGFAGADLAAVDGADRGDFGGGAAHEEFVAEVEIFAREVAFDDAETGVLRQREDGVAGNAVEQCGADRGGVQFVAEDEEQVFARAFAEQAGRSEGDAFAEAQATRFAGDELAGEIIAAGFRARGNGVRCEALPTGDAGVDALLQHAGAEVLAHLPCRDGHVGGRVGGQAEAAQSAVRDRAQIIGGEVIGLQHVATGGVDLVQRVRHRHVVDLGRGEQAPVVIGEAEDRRAVRCVVAADALEHRRTVMHDVRHHMRRRLRPGLDRAVVPNPFGVALRHGGSPLSMMARSLPQPIRRRCAAEWASCGLSKWGARAVSMPRFRGIKRLRGRRMRRCGEPSQTKTGPCGPVP